MGLFSRFVSKLKGESTASILEWDELSSELLAADLGPVLSEKLIAEGKKIKGDDAEGALREILQSHLSQKNRGLAQAASPAVILVVGVNGVGKTTTIGKLASQFHQNGLKVVLGAADTFRAAAVDQLKLWGERVGIPVIDHGMNTDPAAVAFDAVKQAVEMKADIVIIDTAGRLHTKVNLMTELGKIKRVIQKFIPEAPHEVMLVLDGSTGQNAFIQAQEFTKVTEITSLAITKLDGTAKGGVVIGISDQFKIPVKYIGVGEKISDLQVFNKTTFVDSLFAKK